MVHLAFAPGSKRGWLGLPLGAFSDKASAPHLLHCTKKLMGFSINIFAYSSDMYDMHCSCYIKHVEAWLCTVESISMN